MQTRNPEAVVLDNLDDAIVGIDTNENGNTVFVYSYESMVDIVEEDVESSECIGEDPFDSNSREVAAEYVDYNVLRLLPYLAPNEPLVTFEFECDECEA